MRPCPATQSDMILIRALPALQPPNEGYNVPPNPFRSAP